MERGGQQHCRKEHISLKRKGISSLWILPRVLLLSLGSGSCLVQSVCVCVRSKKQDTLISETYVNADLGYTCIPVFVCVLASAEGASDGE